MHSIIHFIIQPFTYSLPTLFMLYPFHYPPSTLFTLILFTPQFIHFIYSSFPSSTLHPLHHPLHHPNFIHTSCPLCILTFISFMLHPPFIHCIKIHSIYLPSTPSSHNPLYPLVTHSLFTLCPPFIHPSSTPFTLHPLLHSGCISFSLCLPFIHSLSFLILFIPSNLHSLSMHFPSILYPSSIHSIHPSFILYSSSIHFSLTHPHYIHPQSTTSALHPLHSATIHTIQSPFIHHPHHPSTIHAIHAIHSSCTLHPLHPSPFTFYPYSIHLPSTLSINHPPLVHSTVKTRSTPELSLECPEISVRQDLASVTWREVLHPCQVLSWILELLYTVHLTKPTPTL